MDERNERLVVDRIVASLEPDIGYRVAHHDDLHYGFTPVRVIEVADGSIEAGTTASSGRKAKPPPELPDDLAAAMRGNKAARGHWDAFTPGKQREYADWITGAKGADTRASRVVQAVEWIAEGKTRNWKYANC